MLGEAGDSEVIARLLLLEARDPKAPITLHINSEGGSLALVDSVLSLKCPIATRCAGRAQDIAAIVLACGAKGHRSATAHSSIAFTRQRVAAASLEALRERQRVDQRLAELFQAATGRPLVYRAFGAEEARAYGLIDTIAV
jgi:ATP-dependent Clp protease protease subunit